MTKEEYILMMNLEEYKIVLEFLKNGKLKEYHDLVDVLDDAKNRLLLLMNENPQKIYDDIVFEYLKKCFDMTLYTPGLTTGIKDSKSGVTIFTYNGFTKKDGILVDEDTRFDLASTTKLFTTILALKLVSEGKFDLNRNVSDYKKFDYLDIPIEKMVKFYYNLRTDGRLDDNISLDELQRRLLNTKVIESDTFIYSDIPFIILKYLLPQADLNFRNYFNDEMGLLQTSYDRSFGILTGGAADELNLVNDPKARLIEKYNLNPGHAGIFSTSKDLIKLFDNLNNGFLKHQYILKMITPILDVPILLNEDGTVKMKSADLTLNVNRAMGVYFKHPGGIKVCDIPDIMSDESFAIAGFTGSYALFDLKNEISTNILANPLSDMSERVIDVGDLKYAISGKKTKVIQDGEVIQTMSFSRISNDLKEFQVYTLVKLRFAKNVLENKALSEQSSVLYNEISRVFEKERVFRK